MKSLEEIKNQQRIDLTKKELFKKDLEQLINKYSLENSSNTPNWILADYLINCLDNFNNTINTRTTWYESDEED